MSVTVFLREIIKCILPIVLKEQPGNSTKTSVSDSWAYTDFCLKASNDVFTFSNFRKNKVYRRILEHVNVRTGQLYLDEIIKIRKELLLDIDKIKENDLYGNPDLYEYNGVGKISPSTLRYVKVFADLLRMFNKLDEYKIAEIGVGYGGQCRIINSIAKPKEYTLIDIKPALLLAQRYLDGYDMSSTIKYKTIDDLSTYIKNYDLVISNYAFTELRREIQEVYLDKIILNSKRGYITYNEITPNYFKSYKKKELLSVIPNSHIIEETPLTHYKNCIIIWGNK